MGAGQVPAGAVPAGNDQLAASASLGPVTNAVRYDPATRAILFNVDGTVAVIDWVDQAVELALTLPLKSLASSPKVGFDATKYRGMLPGREAATVNDVVRTALASLLASGLVKILKISVRPSPLAYEVRYQNLNIPSSTPRNFLLPG